MGWIGRDNIYKSRRSTSSIDSDIRKAREAGRCEALREVIDFRNWLRAEIEQYAARTDHARRNVGVAGLSNFHAEYHAIGQKLVDVLAEFDRRIATPPTN